MFLFFLFPFPLFSLFLSLSFFISLFLSFFLPFISFFLSSLSSLSHLLFHLLFSLSLSLPSPPCIAKSIMREELDGLGHATRAATCQGLNEGTANCATARGAQLCQAVSGERGMQA